MTRILRLEAEYECYPLWEIMTPPDGESVRNVDPAELGISPPLVNRLLDWKSEFDSTLNHDYPPDSEFPTNEARDRFKVMGAAIAESLRQELCSGIFIEHVPYSG